MSPAAPRFTDRADDASHAGEAARRRSVSTWLMQLGRTLKTCRLYDGENPTVIKFREELAAGLVELVRQEGEIVLGFTSTEVTWEEESIHTARSRDDNLALPFYRDGIRGVAFQAGLEPLEVESFLDQLLQVSGPRGSDEDLVTLLWDAQLPHLHVDCVPVDGDIDGVGGAVSGLHLTTGTGGASPSGPAPWPKPQLSLVEGAVLPPLAQSPVTAGPTPGRSDDWETASQAGEPEPVFERLEHQSAAEIERFQHEWNAERSAGPVRSALILVGNCLAARPTDGDRLDLHYFLTRVLREAIHLARWDDAREALGLIRGCGVPGWSPADLVHDLIGPSSVVTPRAVASLDQQEAARVEAFFRFAEDLGPDAVEWLMNVLALSQQKRVRRPLTRVIAELCRDDPGRLRQWMEHREWYVVRNVVHILGWIGGSGVIDLMRTAIHHPEPRVRQEVVAALGQIDDPAVRPILLGMLDAASGRPLLGILHQLSLRHDSEVSRRLLRLMLAADFATRPAEERRAVYMALAGAGGDEVLPALEAEIFKGGWLVRGPDPHRQAVARCLARIGTPAALAILERGAAAKRPAIQKACRDALSGAGSNE